ncbi:sirohydrochlorin cobaltochelatase [Azotosporobacter soli]|uniref:sirohydrochlorin cobaltochelatase n=1 Tax=Azotosporobacter soli TaxID=3055040 RepID=UPI0031FEF9DE
MKKKNCFVMTLLLLTLSFGLFGQGQALAAPEAGKKAILMVSFGTTFNDTRKVTIDAVTDKVKAAFPDYEVRQAYTSRIIIKKLMDRDNRQVDTEKQALEKLKEEGYSEVIVQTLHMEAGDEYDKVLKIVDSHVKAKSFERLTLGRPIFYFTGQEEKPDDYALAINALKLQLPKLTEKEAVAFMGHGGVHPSNTAYAALQLKMQDAGLKNVYVFTVDGYPTIENVIAKAKANKVEKITLMPLMVVAGDHANNDMAGDEPNSYKSQLIKAGFKVDAYLHGLGENSGIQDIYVQHVKDAIENTYDKTKRGADRPAIPVVE